MSTITDLIPLLNAKTRERKLSWEVADENEIWIKIGINLIEIRHVQDESESFVSVGIRNSQGNLIDKEIFPGFDYHAEILRDLFKIAKRQSLKADENIDRIISQLEDL